MRITDLPAADQRAIRAGRSRAAGTAVRPAARPSRPRAALTGRTSHRCETCGATFGAYPTAERHADGDHAGAVRISCVL